jgi:hypothetical protein
VLLLFSIYGIVTSRAAFDFVGFCNHQSRTGLFSALGGEMLSQVAVMCFLGLLLAVLQTIFNGVSCPIQQVQNTSK